MPVYFWCVMLAWIWVYLSKGPVAMAMNKLGGYDNRNPRAQQAELTGWGARATAAHANGFEAFAPFGAPGKVWSILLNERSQPCELLVRTCSRGSGVVGVIRSSKPPEAKT